MSADKYVLPVCQQTHFKDTEIFEQEENLCFLHLSTLSINKRFNRIVETGCNLAYSQANKEKYTFKDGLSLKI